MQSTMANNYVCAPTRVEVPSQGLTTATTNAAVPTGWTPTNAHPMASCSPMGANANDNVPEFNASHMSSITADGVHDYSDCSAATANSEHNSQLLHPDMRGLEHYGYVQDVLQGVLDLVTGSTEFPLPVAVPSLRVLSQHANSPMGTAALSYEFPPCVAAAVVVNSSCNSHSCNTYHPAERRRGALVQPLQCSNQRPVTSARNSTNARTSTSTSTPTSTSTSVGARISTSVGDQFWVLVRTAWSPIRSFQRWQVGGCRSSGLQVTQSTSTNINTN
jgi:hypothetical protein